MCGWLWLNLRAWLIVMSVCFVCGWTLFLYMWPYKSLYVRIVISVCMCSFFMFASCGCLCVSYKRFGPPAVDKRLCASGGPKLVAFSYIIAAFSSSETNIIESWCHNKEGVMLHCMCVHGFICHIVVRTFWPVSINPIPNLGLLKGWDLVWWFWFRLGKEAGESVMYTYLYYLNISNPIWGYRKV